MFELSEQQVSAINAAHLEKRNQRFLEELRRLKWVPAGMSDEQALERIKAAVDDGRKLDIIDDEDAVRMAALAFLPEKTRNDQRIAQLVTTVLNNTDSPAQERLDFIFRQILKIR